MRADLVGWLFHDFLELARLHALQKGRKLIAGKLHFEICTEYYFLTEIEILIAGVVKREAWLLVHSSSSLKSFTGR